MFSQAFKHPFQCATAGTIFGVQYVYLACKETLFMVHAGSGKVVTQWQAHEKSSILFLRLSQDETRLAVVTADDKAVHILECDGLRHKNRRLMPKRPSSVVFTPDGSHVLCADKFGDVYALPLEHVVLAEAELETEATEDYPEPPLKRAKPAATELTVHSQRNLKALQNQLLTADKKMHRQQKKHLMNGASLAFTGDPQLGHVSLLTDILTTTRNMPRSTASNEAGNLAGRAQSLIITADRDEHIRVSRGLPQAHIIEAFCLGHAQFISKLCLLPNDLLVSGGGDDFLCVWSLRDYKLLGKLPLRTLVAEAKGIADDAADQPSIAVTGLYHIGGPGSEPEVLCICEGVPSIFRFSLDISDREMRMLSWKVDARRLPGNPLSVSKLTDDLLVCLDGVHNAGSVNEPRASPGPRLQALHRTHAAEIFVKKTEELGDNLEGQAHLSGLRNLLYSTENLRKRGHEDAEVG